MEKPEGLYTRGYSYLHRDLWNRVLGNFDFIFGYKSGNLEGLLRVDKKSHFELKHCLKNDLSPQVGEVSREKWELSVSVVLTSLPPRTPFPSGGSVAGARRPTERQLRPKRGPVSLSDSSRYSRSPGHPFLGKLSIPAPLPFQ